jgi:hypothetical protein
MRIAGIIGVQPDRPNEVKPVPSAEAAVTAVVDDLRSENLSDLMAILGRARNGCWTRATRLPTATAVSVSSPPKPLEETQDGAILDLPGRSDFCSARA